MCLIIVCGLRSAGNTEVRTRILSKIEQNPDITLQVAVECQQLLNLKRGSHIVQQSIPATRPAVNAVQKQQNSTSPGSTYKKPSSTCRNFSGWYFTWNCSFKTHLCREWKEIGHKKGFCLPLVHKITHKRPHKLTAKKNTYSLWKIFLPNTKSNWNYVSKTGQLLCSVTNKHRLGHNPHLTETMENHRLASTNSYNTCSAEYIWGIVSTSLEKLPATIEIENKTAFGKLHRADSKHNLLGLVDISLNSVCNAVSRSPAQWHYAADWRHQQAFFPGIYKWPRTLTQAEATLTLKPSVTPVFRPKRPVPYAALTLVDRELKRLEEMKVIPSVTYSQWAPPIVVIKKSRLLNLGVYWFFKWAQQSTRGSPIPTSGSWWYIDHIQWQHLFSQTRPHKGPFTNWGFYSFQGTADNKNTAWFISIHTVTFWCKNSSYYISTNHGHYVNWNWRCSSISRQYHCCV